MITTTLTSLPKRLLYSTLLALFLFSFLTHLTQAQKPASAPKAVPVRLLIPRINLDQPVVAVGRKPIVVEGKSYTIWETADNEVGWHNLSAPIGEPGNTVLAGHSDIKARVFRDLNDVQTGDEIQVFAADAPEPRRYVVTQKVLVREKGVSIQVRIKNAQWIAPTEDERLTLVTCAYPGATHRLIVIARPLGENE